MFIKFNQVLINVDNITFVKYFKDEKSKKWKARVFCGENHFAEIEIEQEELLNLVNKIKSLK